MTVTRRELIERVLIAAQRARSLAEENEYREAAELLFPGLYRTDGLGVVDVCLGMTAGDREVEPIDVYNLLSLAHREVIVPFAYAARWGEELPPAVSAFTPIEEVTT